MAGDKQGGDSDKNSGDKQGTSKPEDRRLVGNLEPYVIGEDFEDYLVGVNNFFELNSVSDDKYRVRLLMNLIGSTASTKIVKALKPRKFDDEKYDVIIAKCRSLFGIEKNSIVEHFRFNNRAQKEGETISDFAVELQAMAEHCDFGDFLDVALRDRFVAGLRNVHTKKALLKLDSKKKFVEVVESAKREELVFLEAGNMSIAGSERVNNMRGGFGRGRGRASRSRTPYDGRFGRDRSVPRSNSRSDASNMECRYCHQLGHFKRNCPVLSSRQNGGRGFRGGRRGRSVERSGSFQGHTRANVINESFGSMNLRDEEQQRPFVNYDPQDEELIKQIDSLLSKSKSDAIEVARLCVENNTVDFEVDTGSFRLRWIRFCLDCVTFKSILTTF